jgi:hypothetical protein
MRIYLRSSLSKDWNGRTSCNEIVRFADKFLDGISGAAVMGVVGECGGWIFCRDLRAFGLP